MGLIGGLGLFFGFSCLLGFSLFLLLFVLGVGIAWLSGGSLFWLLGFLLLGLGDSDLIHEGFELGVFQGLLLLLRKLLLLWLGLCTKITVSTKVAFNAK